MCQMSKSKSLPILASAAVLALSVAAHATTVSFSASGSSSDAPLSARADFTTGAGVIDVTLTNTLAASVIRSSGQALSDVSFTLTNAPGTQRAFSGTSGQVGDVNGSGLVTFTTGSPVRFIGQGPPPPGDNTILMETIDGGQLSEMIAQAIANPGIYTNVNNGFQNFSPYRIGPAN